MWKREPVTVPIAERNARRSDGQHLTVIERLVTTGSPTNEENHERY